ncbi:MAG: LSM domain-containing protein, partial [Candidatus Bathyarchaeia archaeon]
EYKGKMIKCDGHMNILLEGANELKDDQLMTNYGNVLLRGNNILYIVLDANKH